MSEKPGKGLPYQSDSSLPSSSTTMLYKVSVCLYLFIFLPLHFFFLFAKSVFMAESLLDHDLSFYFIVNTHWQLKFNIYSLANIFAESLKENTKRRLCELCL